MDGTGICESKNWLIHKWKNNLAEAILSWSVGQCGDESHKQKCRKMWGMVLYPPRPPKLSFSKHSLHSAADVAKIRFSSFGSVGDVRLLRFYPGPSSSLCFISVTPSPHIWSASRALLSRWQKWCIYPGTGHREDACGRCDLKWQLRCCLLSPRIGLGAVQITPRKTPSPLARNWNTRPDSRVHTLVDREMQRRCKERTRWPYLF